MYFPPKLLCGQLRREFARDSWPHGGQVMTSDQALQLAMTEAMKGAGYVAPNPLVGCVVLDAHGKFLSKGFHAQIGQAHAEASALRKISDVRKLRGAQVFVTLEPCAHHGRTPPCAEALIAARVGKVVYGVRDPNPQVNGRGEKLLREAGIQVECVQDDQSTPSRTKEDLLSLCEVFLINQTQKRTFIAGKIATSLDGKLALENGESRWITGERAREFGHYLRAYYGAILIGGRTLELDNPKLNVRHSKFPDYQNKVVIWDPTGRRLSKSWNIYKHHKPENIFWIVDEGVSSVSNIDENQILRIPHSHSGLNGLKLAQKLYANGVFSILVEGGGYTLSKLFQQSSIDRMNLFMAPRIIGAGRGWSETLKFSNMKHVLDAKCMRRKTLGSDTLFSFKI